MQHFIVVSIETKSNYTVVGSELELLNLHTIIMYRKQTVRVTLLPQYFQQWFLTYWEKS